MTSSNYMKYELEVKGIKLKVIWKYFETHFQFRSYLPFIQIIFLLKEINGNKGKMIPFNEKLGENKFEIILGILKMILLGFISIATLFDFSVF